MNLSTAQARSNTSSCMHTLPSELLIYIMSLLPSCDLLKLCATCKSFHCLQETSVELQYLVELDANGMADVTLPSSTLDTVTKLRMLRERREAWRTLSFASRNTIPTPGACPAYELVGGMFAKTANGRDLMGVWLSNGKDQDDEGDGEDTGGGFSVEKFGQKRRNVQRSDLGLIMKDFAMDPTQDLIALVDLRHVHVTRRISIHLRTLSTNIHHPYAARSHVYVPYSRTPNIMSSFIQIVDDVVGLWMVSDARPRLVIVNWLTGRILIDQGWGDPWSDIADFAFLSPRAFILLRSEGPGIADLHTFVDPSPDGLHLSTHRATLHFPDVRSDVHVDHLAAHAAPFVGRPPPGRTFMAKREEMVHVITIRYNVSIGERELRQQAHYFQTYVFARTLLRFLNSAVSSPATSGVLDVPWEQWGPSNTRVLPLVVPFAWLRYVHGSRVVLPPARFSHVETPHGRVGQHVLEVLDFGVRREALSNCSDDGDGDGKAGSRPDQGLLSMGIVREPTKLMPADTHVFRAPVVTSLPFRRVQRVHRGAYSGYMLDEDGVIGLTVPAFSVDDVREVDVYTISP